jgi:shikimate dehydrogenase
MIVLTGFMGAGKSTIGGLLAERLGLPFVDVDAVVERREGMPVLQIFDERGEPAFRALEHEETLAALRGEDAVVALGGGALEHPATREALRGATVVHLEVGLAEALRRVGDPASRPLLRGPDVASLFERRLSRYREAATLTVATAGRSPADIVDELIARAASGPRDRDLRLYLLGSGIQHSQSPGTWNRVFAELGLGWSYGLLDVAEDALPDALSLLKDPDVLGYNVTMPYKGWAYEHAAVRSRDVERARGCNWLTMRDDQVACENTDVSGARMLLDAIPCSEHVLLLGAGGTAGAMLTALEGRADRIVVANRTAERADRLVERARGWLGSGTVVTVPWEARAREAGRADLIVNTTALGIRDDTSPLPPFRPRDGVRIYDVVYGADPTPLQRLAARLGVPFADGLAHLEAQAVALLPLWGLDPGHAPLVRSSLALAAGRSPLRWSSAGGIPA